MKDGMINFEMNRAQYR